MSEHQIQQNNSFLKSLFLSHDEGRLRAGWRLLLQSLLLFFIVGCLGVVLVTILVASALTLDPSLISDLLAELKPEYILLGAIGETIAITTSVFLARRYLDKRSIESLGLTLSAQTVIDILTGVGITLLQMGLIYLLMSWQGWITFEGFAWEFDPFPLVIKNTLIFFALFILVGWNEELLSRGYHLQTIASGLNLFWGVILSSAIFGALHLGNPGANWISTAGIFLAGIFFAYGYIRTKQLWLPMGMHLGWNFFEGVVFGFPVSGLDIYPLTRIQVSGPELWTGGVFGPEAGLIVVPALILGAFLIYIYTANQRR
jgi:membrane protease YdiL (CAAX protease family)